MEFSEERRCRRRYGSSTMKALSSPPAFLLVMMALLTKRRSFVASFPSSMLVPRGLTVRSSTLRSSFDLTRKTPASPAIGVMRRPGYKSQGTVLNDSSSASATASSSYQFPSSSTMRPIQANLTKVLMVLYIVSMCITLPLALFPLYLLHKLNLISTPRKENIALRAGCFCSRWCMRLLPFCRVHAIPTNAPVGSIVDDHNRPEEPCVWVCNHTSMLDVFILMAVDHKLRGSRRRPIKIVYWKGLESNPVTKLLFTMCGFIPVQMTANAPGEANEYDTSSFKSLLRNTKKAFEEGFDIGILPEGQLNPTPEKGLLPVFKGAFTLARLSRRPIRMMSICGAHKLWHPDEPDITKTKVVGRNVAVRAYPSPEGRRFASGDEFAATFQNVVGHFGMHGKDMETDKLEQWLDGRAWADIMEEEQKL
mmetsp:Transcript_7606/g.10351  ORF Transcript_7606/g.10351 Transcript_7606/m.10351 type:complete len:422 (-) Transcript_7606:265-1530(-)